MTFTVRLTSAHDGGPLAVSIDQFDPLAGRPDGLFVVTRTLPAVGHLRAHARFFGTRFSSFSATGWVRVRVSEPLD